MRRWRFKLELEHASDELVAELRSVALRARRVGACTDSHTWTVDEALYQRTVEEPPPFQAARSFGSPSRPVAKPRRGGSR